MVVVVVVVVACASDCHDCEATESARAVLHSVIEAKVQACWVGGYDCDGDAGDVVEVDDDAGTAVVAAAEYAVN